MCYLSLCLDTCISKWGVGRERLQRRGGAFRRWGVVWWGGWGYLEAEASGVRAFCWAFVRRQGSESISASVVSSGFMMGHQARYLCNILCNSLQLKSIKYVSWWWTESLCKRKSWYTPLLMHFFLLSHAKWHFLTRRMLDFQMKNVLRP